MMRGTTDEPLPFDPSWKTDQCTKCLERALKATHCLGHRGRELLLIVCNECGAENSWMVPSDSKREA